MCVYIYIHLISRKNKTRNQTTTPIYITLDGLHGRGSTHDADCGIMKKRIQQQRASLIDKFCKPNAYSSKDPYSSA